MQLNRFTFEQYGLESLNTKSMQCRGSVQKDGVLFNNFRKNIPNFNLLLLNHFLRRFNGRDKTFFFEFVVNEGLEQLERHLLRKTALVQFQLRTYNDNGTTRVIDSFTQDLQR